jgi:hypothetical protein
VKHHDGYNEQKKREQEMEKKYPCYAV